MGQRPAFVARHRRGEEGSRWGSRAVVGDWRRRRRRRRRRRKHSCSRGVA